MIYNITKTKGENTMNEVEKKFESFCKQSIYNFETLEERYRDDLDFHDVPVWTIRELMQKAYDLGREDAMKEMRSE